jgi:RND family efflux transporter MFP subunit
MMPRRSLGAAWALVVVALVSTCKKRESAHEHASDHPAGHDHHERGHGHGESPFVRITRWSEHLELFAEHPPAVAGQKTEMLAHLTVLDGFRPLDGAELRLELDGPAPIRAEARAPAGPGNYRLVFVPARAGTYRGRLLVRGSVPDSVEGVTIEVFDKMPERERASAQEHEEGRFIELLKEQQWGVPFATAFALPGTLIASIEVAGTVTTPPGGFAEVGAPIAGRVVAPARGLPRPGESVRKHQVLATLAPAPSSPEEAARASLAVSEAEARLSRARSAVERAERLIVDQAISQRELEDARREVGLAEDGLRAAESARQLFSGAKGGSGSGSWRLVSPIDGSLVDVTATPGAAVAPGAVLFRVVDTRELWIRARVPEQDAARLRSDRDASFKMAGVEDFLPIDLTGEDASASLVTIGRTVDATSRTVDVIYALRAPDSRLRVGGLVRVSLPTGDDFSGIVVPKSAIVNAEGRELVYVQVDGEHFEERAVRIGPSQGGLVGISRGLRPKERVVVRGAHVVRLAARSGSTEPHGHVH